MLELLGVKINFDYGVILYFKFFYVFDLQVFLAYLQVLLQCEIFHKMMGSTALFLGSWSFGSAKQILSQLFHSCHSFTLMYSISSLHFSHRSCEKRVKGLAQGPIVGQMWVLYHICIVFCQSEDLNLWPPDHMLPFSNLFSTPPQNRWRGGLRPHGSFGPRDSWRVQFPEPYCSTPAKELWQFFTFYQLCICFSTGRTGTWFWTGCWPPRSVMSWGREWLRSWTGWTSPSTAAPLSPPTTMSSSKHRWLNEWNRPGWVCNTSQS